MHNYICEQNASVNFIGTNIYGKKIILLPASAPNQDFAWPPHLEVDHTAWIPKWSRYQINTKCTKPT